jgi:hypothetical protein
MTTYVRFCVRRGRNSLNIYQVKNVSNKICWEKWNVLFFQQNFSLSTVVFEMIKQEIFMLVHHCASACSVRLFYALYTEHHVIVGWPGILGALSRAEKVNFEKEQTSNVMMVRTYSCIKMKKKQKKD